MIGSEKPNANVNVEQPEKDPDAKNKWWLRLFIWVFVLFIIVVSLWCLIRWLQHLGVFEGVPDWLFLDSGLTAPVATLLASSGVIIAASIAFWNGEKTRREERDKWAESRQQEMERREDEKTKWEESKQQEIERREDEKTKWEESKQRETVRSLRDRYFNITELLSGNSNYAQREAAVYSLVALSDDWASFYGNGIEAAVREQQTCLNVIVGQLRDPFPDEDDKNDHEKDRKRLELIVFKQRVQGVITQRYRPSSPSKEGEWSHLDLDLSFCHLYEPGFSRCVFAAKALFTSADVTGHTDFSEAIFGGITNFAGATFGGTAHFAGVTFTGYTDFADVTFGDTAHFARATFTGHTDFGGVIFGDHTYFSGVIFGDHTYFTAAKFGGKTYFTAAKFGGHSDFSGVIFGGNTDFSGATFSGVSFLIFGGHTGFGGVIFGGDTDFSGATFSNITYFGWAKFGGDTDFSGAKFGGDTSFKEKEDQLPDRQNHEDRKTTSTTPFFDGPSQFTQLPKFNGTVLSTCPTLTDGSDPRVFFVGAIFLDEQDVEE